jgi:hypothetical protein
MLFPQLEEKLQASKQALNTATSEKQKATGAAIPGGPDMDY